MSAKAEVTKVSSKGQVVIPRSLREVLQIEPGTRLSILPVGDSMLLMQKLEVPDPAEALEELFTRLDKIRPKITENEIEEEIQAFRRAKQR